MTVWRGFEHILQNLFQKRLTSQRTPARGHGDPHLTMMALMAELPLPSAFPSSRAVHRLLPGTSFPGAAGLAQGS